MKRNIMEDLREQIDKINEELLILIKRRMQLSKKVAKYKFERNLEIFDSAREIEILNSASKKARAMDLSEGFIREMFQLILKEAKTEQDNFIDGIIAKNKN